MPDPVNSRAAGSGQAGDARGPGAVDVMVAFNEAINAGDLDRLAALMSNDHRFVDTAGNEVAGRDACLEAWRGFFAEFPGYRNVFEQIHAVGTGEATAVGRSECSDPRLAGPARWHAVVRAGLVAIWQVDDVDR